MAQCRFCKKRFASAESPRDIEERVEGLLAPEIKRVRREAEERERQAAERQREEKKRELTAYGTQVASEELDEEGIRPGLERYLILRRVEQELGSKLTGTENRGKVEALVDQILDEELGE